MDRFREREEEFDLVDVAISPLAASSPPLEPEGSSGLLCCRSTDEAYIAKWGDERFERLYRSVGVPTIWGWAEDSGLRPCPVYLRHCVLAAEKLGPACLDSFLDDTYLVDRSTTLRAYLQQHPEVMATPPPPELAERYGG